MHVFNWVCRAGMAALSVIFSHYKHKNKCAKCPHIAYQPISAEIYLLAAYSTLAEIISCALYACWPTYIFLRFMRSSRHICRRAFSDPADIYFCARPADIYYLSLYAYWPTYITPRCKHTSSIGKHHYVIIFGLLGDVGTHMGSIGKQVILLCHHAR